MANSEIGRMLRVDELQPKTVIVLAREDRPHMITAWVTRVGVDFVAFGMGEVNTTLIALRHPDGRLTDDTGARILVFEYLGVV
jgi:hypothetical protein